MELPTFINLKKESFMTTNHKVARRKLSLLELASELNNVSKACQRMGHSLQQSYEISAPTKGAT